MCSRLPLVVETMAGIVGEEAAISYANRYGGRDMRYTRCNPDANGEDNQTLVDTFGARKARKILAEFLPGRVYLPSCEHIARARVVAMAKDLSGQKRADLSKLFGVSERTIYRWLAA